LSPKLYSELKGKKKLEKKGGKFELIMAVPGERNIGPSIKETKKW